MTFSRSFEDAAAAPNPPEAADPALASISSQKLFPRHTVLTVQQVADALSLTKQHVINLIDGGALRAIDVGGTPVKKGQLRRNYRIPVSAYDAFIEKRKF